MGQAARIAQVAAQLQCRQAAAGRERQRPVGLLMQQDSRGIHAELVDRLLHDQVEVPRQVAAAGDRGIDAPQGPASAKAAPDLLVQAMDLRLGPPPLDAQGDAMRHREHRAGRGLRDRPRPTIAATPTILSSTSSG